MDLIAVHKSVGKAIIWSGGGQNFQMSVKVNIIEQGRTYTLPLLKEPRYGHCVVTTNQKEILIVGGMKKLFGYSLPEDEGKQVLVFKDGKWIHHSNLTEQRVYSVVVQMPNGIYVFGGMHNPETSEFLPNGSKEWQPGPCLPGEGIWKGSGVSISQHDLVLVGGNNTFLCQERLLKFNIITQEWTLVANLKNFGNTSCAIYKNSIFVDNTQIIDISTGTVRNGAIMNHGRYGHAMGVMKWDGVPRLVIVKGFCHDEKEVNTIEAWNEFTEEWEVVQEDLTKEIVDQPPGNSSDLHHQQRDSHRSMCILL